MLLSDIDTWNVGALQSIAFELGDELKTIEGVAGDLELISRLPGWDSPAADAARGKIHSTTGRVLDDAAAIGAVQQLAEETSAAVAKLQSELAAVRADVARRRVGFYSSPPMATSQSPGRPISGKSCSPSPTTSRLGPRR